VNAEVPESAFPKMVEEIGEDVMEKRLGPGSPLG
jgi:hypothetical protein